MAMEERTLELTIISAQGLKKVSTFGHDISYAVAYIFSSQSKSTGVDSKGREDPRWNSKLSLTCDEKLLHRKGSYVTVDIYHYGSFTNKLVGTSRISLLDVGKLIGSSKPTSMELEVYRPSGKVKGVLNVSVKVGEKYTVIQRTPPPQAFLAPAGYQTGYQTYPQYPQSNAGTELGFTRANEASSPSKGKGPSTPASADSQAIEPVTGIPVTAYPPQANGQQYDPRYYGSQYAGPQQYYYPPQGYAPYPQGYAPYGYQSSQYAAGPSRYQGSSSSGAGFGLLGGLLGGLLVGEVIGGLF